MNNSISLHVWGDYACFSRPELKVERLSYEVMTPSAARGILTAIYWKPEFRWVIDSIRVLKPIRFTQVRRNELGTRIVTPKKEIITGQKKDAPCIFIEDKRQQRAATILCDVGYIITAHVEIVNDLPGLNNVTKHLEIFKRRAAQGQCFHQPCLGTREFPAMFELADENGTADELPAEDRNRSFGLMLHDLVYEDDKDGAITCIDHEKSTVDTKCYKTQSATPHFFMASLTDGLMTVPPLNRSLS